MESVLPLDVLGPRAYSLWAKGVRQGVRHIPFRGYVPLVLTPGKFLLQGGQTKGSDKLQNVLGYGRTSGFLPVLDPMAQDGLTLYPVHQFLDGYAVVMG